MVSPVNAQIAVLSDTHMPRGGRCLPSACVERLRAADLIVHAGDFVQLSVLRELEEFGEVLAVHGNVDDPELCAVLPGKRMIEIGKARLGLVHDAGPARGRIDRLRRWFPQGDAVIFGHSHMPLHEQAPDGFQIFNPGSPTERRRAPARSMGGVEVQNGHVNFELITLG